MGKISVELNDSHDGDFMIDDDDMLMTFDIKDDGIRIKKTYFEDFKLGEVEKFLSRCRGYLSHKSIRDNLIELKKKKYNKLSSRMHTYSTPAGSASFSSMWTNAGP